MYDEKHRTVMENRTGAYNILYVDDEPQNLYLFRSFFEHDYNVLTAESGNEALQLLQQQEIQVLLADQRMPGINGIQLLETVAREYPQTVRILVTGYADIDVVIDAINRGSVYRYLSKPWDIEEIKATIRNALEVYELKRKNQTLIGSLRRKIEELNFLNQLQLDLKSLGDGESIIAKSITTLQQELQAERGIHIELRAGGIQTRGDLDRDPGLSPQKLESLAARLRLATVTAPVATFAGQTDPRGVCILPLLFQDTSFGYLLFVFPEGRTFDPGDLPFAEAASNVVSSVLYSQHVHRQEMKKEQFLVLGQMASMIVHDLKGPLASILGFVSLLQAELAEAQREEFAGIINQEVRRLIDMVEELLAFSRGQSHLQIDQIDFPALMREIMDLFAPGLKKENIATEVSLDGLQILAGDRNKIKKVFINLIQNAREYLQNVEDKRIIRILSEREDRSVLIRVINNGPPIPGQLLPKLFDPFFSYGKDQGTGLGLTICKKIIEEHGGSIEVYSESGSNEFRIVIPSESTPGRDSKNRNPAP